jgi:hypothetical protein
MLILVAGLFCWALLTWTLTVEQEAFGAVIALVVALALAPLGEARRARPPPPEDEGGYGLWVVNQVCDPAEVRTGRGSTTIRLHMTDGAP